MGLIWISGTKPIITPAPSAINMLYLYDTTGTADDAMRLNDTGLKGCSEFAAAMNALTVGSTTFSITEMAETTFISNVATNLTGIDILIVGSAIGDYTGTPASQLDTWLRAGGGLLLYSDGSLGGGADNTVGADSRRSMGCMTYGFDCAPDQKEGVVTSTLPSGSIFGNALTFRGEGTSPWVLNQTTAEHAAQGNPTVVVARSNQSLSKTTGLTYTGTKTNLGYSTPDSGRVVFLFDRQPLWNTGSTGTDISEVDNQQLLENIVIWLAKL